MIAREWEKRMFGRGSLSEEMPEAPAGADLPAYVRVEAGLALSVSGASGETRICGRREAGAFRFRFPKGAGNGLEAMLVNVAGGLAGGDRLSIALDLTAQAALSVSGAAAERIYRSAGADTAINLALAVDDSSTLFWLPQETILQQGARLSRDVEIDLAEGATLLFGEMLCFGRRAMGERFSQGRLGEAWRIRRGGKLAFADFVRLDGAFADDLARPAALGAGAAMATLILAQAEAGERLAALRAVLALHPQVEAGASDLGGLVIARLLAEDAAALRQAYLAAVQALAPPGARLPRTLLADLNSRTPG